MAGGDCMFSSDDVVAKSPNDRRLYRVIRLDNGLLALLVHDPEIFLDHQNSKAEDNDSNGDETEDGSEGEEDDEDEDGDEEEEEDEDEGDEMTQTKKAAAAMCVGMGSYSDPLEAQGLAHLLEHMLFRGSKEFPVENEYKKYMSQHGGYSNANTKMECTSYYFEVNREFLKGALRRFSQFFVSPLIKMEAMEREVQAIDSEFNRVLQSDACRLEQLQRHTSLPGHPFNRFSWGNKKSLVDTMEKAIDLRKQILKMYRDYYHGGLMKLVVIGGEPLDVLQNWVVELFGNIRKGPMVNPEVKVEGPFWKPGKVYRLEAVKDVHFLDLTWTLPCLRQEYSKSPEYYISYLLEHVNGFCLITYSELKLWKLVGRGGLFYFLKARGWATYLSARIGDDGMHHSFFVMSMCLTDSGLEKIFEIIGFVYQYLKLMRQVSPQEWIFKELQEIGCLGVEFTEEESQDDYAKRLAVNLLLYPAANIICADYIWDAELIKHVLGFFNPENMRIDVLTKSFNFEACQVEPWFGSRYVEEDISSSLMDIWRDPPEIDGSFYLPKENEFIPSDFSIRADNELNNLSNVSSPRCILDEPLMELWYKLDSTFKVPHANAYFRIYLKGGYDNVKNCVLTKLFIRLLKDELNEIAYQASIAKLRTHAYILKDKLLLKVYGFNDKLPVLLTKLLATAKSFLPTEDRFEVIRENMKRTLKNTNMKPLRHSSYLRSQILSKIFYDVDEKLQVLDQLSVDDLKAFIPELLSQLYVEGFCHGNLSEEEAIAISNIFKTVFSAQPLPYNMRHKNKAIHLPAGANLVTDVNVKNRMEKNSVVELYFQVEKDPGMDSDKLDVLIDLFEKIVEEPMFDQLRTKEQLGYVVNCSPRITCGVAGFSFYVESSKYSPIYLQERVDNFINGLEELLEGLDDDSFENYKGGLMAEIFKIDTSLLDETNRLWGQMFRGSDAFDESKKLAEALESIQKSDVVNWYKTYLQQSSPQRRRLAIRVWGCNTDLKEAEMRSETEQVIKDIAAFKRSMSNRQSEKTTFPLILLQKFLHFDTTNIERAMPCVCKIIGKFPWKSPKMSISCENIDFRKKYSVKPQKFTRILWKLCGNFPKIWMKF